MPTPKKYESEAERQAAYRDRQRRARAEERASKGLPPVPAVPTMPGTARWRGLIETARAALETTREEMETYHAERTDRWREGDRAEQMLETTATLEGIINDLEGIEL